MNCTHALAIACSFVLGVASDAADLTSSRWLLTESSVNTFQLDLFFTSQSPVGQDYRLDGYFERYWHNGANNGRQDFSGVLFGDGRINLSVLLPTEPPPFNTLAFYQGTLSPNGGEIVNGTVWNYDGGMGSWSAVAVPEPSSVALLTVACIVALVVGVRRSRRCLRVVLPAANFHSGPPMVLPIRRRPTGITRPSSSGIAIHRRNCYLIRAKPGNKSPRSPLSMTTSSIRFSSLRHLGWTIAFIGCLPPLGHAQVSLEWAARYSGPSNVIDQARALVLDAAGNTYVTGGADRNGPTLGGDFVTVKYDANGNQVWTARFGNPGALADAPTAITLDAAGHVYVTGYSHGHPSTITSQDYVTLKYAPDGTQLWAARYSAPANSLSGATSVDYPRAIAVDSDGHVYVTGSSSDSGGNARDYATVKYDAQGTQLWAAIYDSPNHASDSATSLAVNSDGEVYVGGHSGVVKYGPDGNLLWTRSAAVNDLALDPAGNLVVVGPSFLESQDHGEQPDVLVAKYSPAGDPLWTASYDGAIEESDSATHVRIDNAGDIYVTGNSASRCIWVMDDGHEEKVCDTVIVTVKLTANGQRLWAARYGSAEQRFHFPVGLELDAVGNAYVLGSEGPWSRTVTLKYAPNGTRLWATVYSFTNHGWDSPSGIAVTATGSVHVAGSSHWWDGAGSDYFVLKYAQSDRPGLPEIVTPPQDQIVAAGTNVAFAVSATGAEPLTYQWRLHGKPIEDATNATLGLPRVARDQAGDYFVDVCNALGCVVSPNARLTVQPAALHLHSPWKSSHAFGFNLDCFPALTFVIETSTNLQHWTILSTNSGIASGMPLSFPLATNGAPRFFRARSLSEESDESF